MDDTFSSVLAEGEKAQALAPGIDQALSDAHKARLRSEEARRIYDRTLAACLARPGGMTPADQDMIFDLCAAEDVKAALREDIARRGVTPEIRNGRQRFAKENPSVAALLRYSEYQRRLRGDLKILPRKKAEEEDEGEEEEDDFDRL